HGDRVHHGDVALHVVADTLACVQAGALTHVQGIPVFALDADGGRAVALGQAIDMGQVDAELFHAFDHGGRGGGARHHGLDLVAEVFADLGRRGDHGRMHDGRAAVVRHLVVVDGVEDGLGIDPAQTHVDAGAC